MTDDKETGWTKIQIRQPDDEVIKYGPSIEVTVAALEGPAIAALAQIDTGAQGTGISPRLAKKLGLKSVASGIAHQAGYPSVRVPYFKVRLSLPSIDLEMEVVGLATLERPHDVLLGRDILSKCRLTVDFMEGVTSLHIKHSSGD